MRILGITDGQTSGAAVIEDGRILAAINEERMVRLKMARGFPRQAIAEVLALSGTETRAIGNVAVAQVNMELREQVSGWPGWFEARARDRDMHSLFFRVASRFGGLAQRAPGLKKVYYGLRRPAYSHRRQRIEEILREDFDISAPVRFVHHHMAHAASAYYTSNFDEALVVTMDGGGDGHCSHLYSVKNGAFQLLGAADSYDSLGNYYAYITAICGFKAKRHEGKITGLSARGSPAYRHLLDSMIACENGRLVNRGKVLFNRALDRIRAGLPEQWSLEDLSASIQLVAEDVARDYVRHWIERTGHRNLALAGGLFANVRINEELHSLPGVARTFVHPGMSDEGLAVGAALAVQGALDREKGRPHRPRQLDDVYFGNEYGEKEIAGALEGAGLRAMHSPGTIGGRIAEKLAEGKVVARFNGRMEYGPRALGNRSILYQPGDPSVNDWLNELLHRTEFMPFAPSSLHEHSHQLYKKHDGALDTARFMTITFHCTPWMTERCSGVVHVDNTARPQVVRKQDNPSYYQIIQEYHRRTGVPVIINTSFNMHEEPIVRTPDDAVRAFLDSALDYLAIGDFLVEGPVGSYATRRKWEGKSKWGCPVASPTCR
ncbi:MAG: carbamoyltransferase C-terminal domain-containing protein [Acidobacteriota bacterium]